MPSTFERVEYSIEEARRQARPRPTATRGRGGGGGGGGGGRPPSTVIPGTSRWRLESI